MLNPIMLELLCCPETHQSLRLAEPSLLASLNDAVRGGRVKNKAGVTITENLESALIRVDGAVVYPVRRDIPIMLVEEAIALEQLKAQ